MIEREHILDLAIARMGKLERDLRNAGVAKKSTDDKTDVWLQLDCLNKLKKTITHYQGILAEAVK